MDAFLGHSDTPLWRAEMALPPVPRAQVDPREDVLIVGSGFTGLHTALHLARGGRQVVVCDAGEIGWGCSTRNGGQVSSEMKPDLDDFIAKHGEERGRHILSTGIEAHRHLRRFIADEGIACNYSVCGHFIGAHRPDRMEGLRHFLRQNARLGVEGEEIPQGRVSDFVASPQFHGGVHLPDWASLHPGRLVAELVRLCLAAGVRFVPHCRVSRIEDHVDHITCLAGDQAVRAAHLVMATDGYTDGASRWMRRRVVSLASVVTATEPMDPAAVQALYPRASMVYDTRMNVTYHRPSPDGDRVVIGTVVPVDVTNVAACLPRVRRNILRLFPQLDGVKIAHVWTGFVGATFSHLPHVGMHGRMGYAIGYNGTGVAMSAYLGMKLAQKMLGNGGETALDGLELETRPLFHGQTWYRRPVLALHDLKDRMASCGATIG
jgi:glycine/D-amino acid oxidase-like deaminating enzyme